MLHHRFYLSPRLLAAIAVAMLMPGSSAPLFAQVFKTQEAALAEVFADADTVRRETLFLGEAQQKAIETAAKMPLNTAIISYYVGEKAGKPYRYAFFEDQVVRTKKAVLLVVVNAAGYIENLEVLAFFEPLDYLPIARWFDLFRGKSLAEGILPGRNIDTVSGATLSVRAFSGVARRALAVLAYIQKQDKKEQHP